LKKVNFTSHFHISPNRNLGSGSAVDITENALGADSDDNWPSLSCQVWCDAITMQSAA
jgi:hypothetical protein